MSSTDLWGNYACFYGLAGAETDSADFWTTANALRAFYQSCTRKVCPQVWIADGQIIFLNLSYPCAGQAFVMVNHRQTDEIKVRGDFAVLPVPYAYGTIIEIHYEIGDSDANHK